MNTQVATIYHDIKDDFLTKSELNKKYNVKFTKERELKHYLYGLCISLRHDTKNYPLSIEDFKIFNEFWGCPASSKKFKESIENETPEFVSFLLETLKGINKKYHKDSRYNTLMKVINAKSEAPVKTSLIEKLMELTKEYKPIFIDEYIDTFIREMNMYKDLPESRRKRNYYLVKDMSFNFNEEKYKERLMPLATRQFTHNIELLASRLLQKVSNPESMKLDYIDIDMKGFKVLIETKDSKFYVRAIWCAEDSMIVAPHLRYICTEKTK